MPHRYSRKITVGLGVASALVVALAVVAFVSGERFVATTRAIMTIQSRRLALVTLTTSLERAENAARSYAATGDSVARSAYARGVDSLGPALSRLGTLLADEPAQAARLAVVRGLVDSATGALGAVVAGGGRPDTARSTASMLTGSDAVLAAERQLQQMDRVESDNFATRLAEETNGRRWLLAIVAAVVLISVSFAWFIRRSLLRDLAGRARAEAALRASEAKFSGILNIAADAIVTVDLGQRILHFNRGAELMFGYRGDEVAGERLDMLLPEGVGPAHRQHIDGFARSQVMARRMGARQEVAGRRRSGATFPAEASISKLETPDGTLFTAVIRDITERKRLERHEHLLAQAGAQIAASLDYETSVRIAVGLAATVGAWAALDIVEDGPADASLRRLVSRHKASLDDPALQSFGQRRLGPDAPSVVLDVIRTGQPALVAPVDDDWLEAHAEHADELDLLRRLEIGSLIVVPLMARETAFGALTIGSLRGEPLFDAADLELAQALASRVSMAIDNARLYGAAQQATRARDEVLAAVSHDLRNPVSAIAMIAERLVRNPPADVAARRELYATIAESARMMYQLMRDLLDVASIEAGRLTIHAVPELAAPIVESAVAMVSGHPQAGKVSIRVDASHDLPNVLADRERIVQVLSNLLDNALKFSEPGGTIVVSAAGDAEQVTFAVADQGPGIPSDELPHLFERFWHVQRNSLTRGTGLGLAIAQGIVNAHRGRIWVETAVGRGSTFRFTLPTV